MKKLNKSLSEIVDSLSSRIEYLKKDREALDFSRTASGGNIGLTKDYSEKIFVSDDSKVVVNNVKTFVFNHINKVTAHPIIPKDNDALYELGKKLGLYPLIAEKAKDILQDGYGFLSIGMKNGLPIVVSTDARYIIHNGKDSTISDATEVVVFEVVPSSESERAELGSFPIQEGFNIDDNSEKVISYYYWKDEDGVHLKVFTDYDKGGDEFNLAGLDRIPVVRFVGDAVELDDKKEHYRGLYHMVGALSRAQTLVATKIQTRTVMEPDDNGVVDALAIVNHKNDWKNTGTRQLDTIDANNIPIKDPYSPLTHDHQFLIGAYNLWDKAIQQMLGLIVQSGSEAISEKEVEARQESSEALATIFLSKLSISVSEVYRCLNMFLGLGNSRVEVSGGFVDSVKREKKRSELMMLWNLVKDSGLNGQAIIPMIVETTSLESNDKQALLNSLYKDQFSSPLVVKLKQQIATLNQTVTSLKFQNTLLAAKAAERLERQSEYTGMLKSTKQLEANLKQWETEQKNTQEARMEMLRDALAKGDTGAALTILNSIEQVDPLLTDVPKVEVDMNTAQNEFEGNAEQQVSRAIVNSVSAANNISQPQQQIPTIQPQYTAQQLSQGGQNGAVPTVNIGRS